VFSQLLLQLVAQAGWGEGEDVVRQQAAVAVVEQHPDGFAG
jgi:hypothetical protein